MDIKDAPTLSSKTGGIRANMNYKFDEELSGFYQLEYAYQQDYARNPNNYATYYILVEPGITYKSITAKLGYESLAADRKNHAFQTPLADAHNFNGWADIFTTTPSSGLTDFYVGLEHKTKSNYRLLNEVETMFTFHNFTSKRLAINYGKEYDFMAQKSFNKNYYGGIKFAYYQRSSLGLTKDTTKIMLFSGLKF